MNRTDLILLGARPGMGKTSFALNITRHAAVKAGRKGAIGVVIGSEGDGLSRLIREKCDFLVSIPMSGHIDSLNAAVAAAILMFEKKRQG